MISNMVDAFRAVECVLIIQNSTLSELYLNSSCVNYSSVPISTVSHSVIRPFVL
jgi:hypothetical protein